MSMSYDCTIAKFCFDRKELCCLGSQVKIDVQGVIQTDAAVNPGVSSSARPPLLHCLRYKSAFRALQLNHVTCLAAVYLESYIAHLVNDAAPQSLKNLRWL